MKKIKKILVTGGLGYIGSHSVVSLIEDGYEVVIVDNLSNTNISVLDKINKITKSAVNFLELDIRDKDSLKTIDTTIPTLYKQYPSLAPASPKFSTNSPASKCPLLSHKS